MIRSGATGELHLLHIDEIAYAGACHEECSIMPCQPDTRALKCIDFVTMVGQQFQLKASDAQALFSTRPLSSGLNTAITRRINNGRFVFHLGIGPDRFISFYPYSLNPIDPLKVFWPCLMNGLSILSCIFFYTNYANKIMTLTKPTE